MGLEFSAEKVMNIDLRFTDKEITAWGGMSLMKRMLDHLGFDAALAGCGLPQPGSNPPASEYLSPL